MAIFLFCFILDHPQHTTAGFQDKTEDSMQEEAYIYDSPRPVIPPAPTRRTLSDMSGAMAAFSALSIDSAVETGKFLALSELSN